MQRLQYNKDLRLNTRTFAAVTICVSCTPALSIDSSTEDIRCSKAKFLGRNGEYMQ